MVSVRYGGKRGKKITLVESTDMVVVRAPGRAMAEPMVRSRESVEIFKNADCVAHFPDAGVEVLRLPVKSKKSRDQARSVLKKEKALSFAGRVFCDRRAKQPVVYTENFFVQFDEEAPERKCRSLLESYGLTVKRELGYAAHAYFVQAAEGTGSKIFDIGEKLLEEPMVQLCHPELVRPVSRRQAFPQQWHLKDATIGGRAVKAHAHVEEAWATSTGRDIVIAVIDDGVDIDHPELQTGNKIVSPRDVTRRLNSARPADFRDNHGTACAGVACAAGRQGASGVAPDARLMPIRLASGLGSQAEADAFEWAADHGADVISCSWGPVDGDWTDLNDPLHDQVVALPDSTRLAIDYAITTGRGGLGCVITWAAGNGNESVDNDGYAAYEKVMAVAACSDRSKKSVYSDHGAALWCAFPSSDFGNPLTPGIWTVDRRGSDGYNPSSSGGDAAGDYTDSFGGTSSACPGAAGVAALVLARNPALRWDEVREILKSSCDRIDTAGAQYDGQGHSRLYGHGRLNAKKATDLAAPATASFQTLHTARQTVPIQDQKTSVLSVAVGDTKKIQNVKIHVDIEHSWVGDLVVALVPPSGSGTGKMTLQSRAGGSQKNLKTIYDTINTAALGDLIGQTPTGTWKLEVSDKANQDQGSILSFTVELAL
ncbi:MAG: S8 family serine peptidase [Planctomycetota bacterium]